MRSALGAGCRNRLNINKGPQINPAQIICFKSQLNCIFKIAVLDDQRN